MTERQPRRNETNKFGLREGRVKARAQNTVLERSSQAVPMRFGMEDCHGNASRWRGGELVLLKANFTDVQKVEITDTTGA